MIFPALPKPIKNGPAIATALKAIKPLIWRGDDWRGNTLAGGCRFICTALRVTEHPERHNALKLVQGCLGAYATVTAFGVANKQIPARFSIAEDQNYRLAWLNYLIKELEK